MRTVPSTSLSNPASHVLLWMYWPVSLLARSFARSHVSPPSVHDHLWGDRSHYDVVVLSLQPWGSTSRQCSSRTSSCKSGTWEGKPPSGACEATAPQNDCRALHRPYWRCYYVDTSGIIYVVDSSDTERIETSKEALMGMLNVRAPPCVTVDSRICDTAPRR